MDALDRWQKRIDKIDEKILALFERRMQIVKLTARYKKRHGLKPDKKSGGAAEKAAKNARDAGVTAYAEGLYNFLRDASQRYQLDVMKKV